jgi:hypothetical protein
MILNITWLALKGERGTGSGPPQVILGLAGAHC